MSNSVLPLQKLILNNSYCRRVRKLFAYDGILKWLGFVICDKLELRLLPTLLVEMSSHSSLPIHTQCLGALKRFEVCRFCTDYRIGPWRLSMVKYLNKKICLLITEGSITPYPDASSTSSEMSNIKNDH